MSGEGRLAGKIALVTGGASGIGEGIARVFARHGARVIIGDIDEAAGRAVADDLGAGARFLPLDVADEACWTRAMATILAEQGGLDVLVNNAGTGGGGRIEQATLASHQRLTDLNFTGVWLGIRAALPGFAARGGGAVVNISSIDGLVGVEGLSSYVGTKFGVTGLTRSLALELGERNIRVNAIHPGIIETPLLRAAPPAYRERLDKAISRQPIARIGQPEEIGHAALFLASDESAYCTGASLVVDGGHIAGPYRDPV